ncbi:MAG: HEAT repeat domain-containing protein [Planctomycetes bacterium]|nr:HEAT repeat domain-containing protein [Planctomycetota bacterium]
MKSTAQRSHPFLLSMLALLSAVTAAAAEEPVEALLVRARSGEPFDRAAAIAALGSSPSPESLKVLADILRSEPRAGLRLLALDALAARNDRSVLLENLPPLLQDANPSIRHAAAFRLSALATPADTAMLPALVAAIRDEDAQVRLAAADGLIKLGAAGSQALVPALESPDEALQAKALSALSKNPVPESAPALFTLARQGGSPTLRLAAHQALGRLECGMRLLALVHALKDDQPIRLWAAAAAADPWVQALTPEKIQKWIVSRPGNDAGLENLPKLLIPSPGSLLLSRALAEDSSPEVRQTAAESLARYGEQAQKALLSAALFEGEEMGVRLKTLASLGIAGQTYAVPFLRFLATFAQEKDIRKAAGQALDAVQKRLPQSATGVTPTMPSLPSSLSREEVQRSSGDPDDRVKLLAVQAAPSAAHTPGDREALFKLVLKIVEDGHRRAAETSLFPDAGRILFQRAAKRSAQRLLEDAAREERESARGDAGPAAGQSNDKLFRMGLKACDPELRLSAFWSMSHRPFADLWPTLAGILRNPEEDAHLRAAAARRIRLEAEALERSNREFSHDGSSSARDASGGPGETVLLPDPVMALLLRLLEDAEDEVRYQARGALRALSGQDYRFDRQRWKAWAESRRNGGSREVVLHPVSGSWGQEIVFEPMGRALLSFGRPADVAVRGDWAYVAEGEGGVGVYDLSDAAGPRLADRYVTFVPGHLTEAHSWARNANGVCSQIVLEGDRAYLIAQHSGFAVGGVELTALDISQPGRLRYAGGFPTTHGSAMHARIAARGNLVFSAQGASIVLYDFTEAARAMPVGSFQAGAEVAALAAAQPAFVLFGEGGNGLRALDVSDPAKPQARGHYTPAGKVAALLVQGDRVAAGTEKNGLHLLKLLADGGLEAQGVLPLDAPIVSIAGEGSVLYLSTPAGVRAVDVSSRDAPRRIEPALEALRGVRLASWRDRAVAADPFTGLARLSWLEKGWEHLPGSGPPAEARDLEIRAGYAVVAAGEAGLLLYDLRQLAEPRLVQRVPIPGQAWRVTLQGDTAFVAAGAGGLAAVNVADPAQPGPPVSIPVQVLIGKEGGEVRDVFIEGGKAYLAVDRAGLVVADLTDPARPRPLGQLVFDDERATPRAIDVRQGLAAVACGRAGLYLVDVSDPAAPRLFSWFWDEDGHRRMSTWDARIEGQRVFLADADRGLLVLDISDPRKPRLAGRTGAGNAHQVACRGPLALIADGGYGLRAIDASDPASPRRAGSFHHERARFQAARFLDDDTLAAAGTWEVRTFHIAQRGLPLRTAFSLSADGSPTPILSRKGKSLPPEDVPTRYGIDFTLLDAGQDICGEGYPDRSDPGHRLRPVFQDLSDAAGWPRTRVASGSVAVDPRLGRIKFPDGDNDPCRFMGWTPLPMGICHTVRLSGDHVFLSDEEGWNIALWDISGDPLKPVRRGLCCTGGFCIGALWVQGNLAIGGNNMGRFTLFDVSEPDRPVPVGWFPGNARCVVASGHYAFDISGQLVAWDISDPRKPRKAAEVTDGSLALSMTGSHANPQVLATDRHLIGAGGKGLRVIDLADMPHLKLLADHPIPATCLALDGSRLYAGDGGTVRVYDFSDPQRPLLLGRCVLPEHFKCLAVDGNTLYAGYYALQVIDVSDPSAPHLLGRCPQVNFYTGNTEQNAVYSIVARGRAVYAAQPGWGLAVYDVSDRANPRPVRGDTLQTLAMGGDYTGITVRGNRAFSANNWSGVRVVDISDPARPRFEFSTKYHDSGASLGVAANDEIFIYHSATTGNMVFDYRDPRDIREVGRPQPQPQPPAGWGNAGSRHFCLRGNYAYGGGVILDLTCPSRPEEIATFPSASAGALSGDCFYTWGTVVDVRQPYNPRVLAGTPALHGGGWYGRGFYASRGIACSTNRAGLLITDVSDPARPRLLACLSLPHLTCDVWMQGHLAYVATYYGGGDVLDLSDPARPKLIDHFEFGPFWDFGGWDNLVCYQSAAIDGDYLCANEYYSGLHVIDVPTAAVVPRGRLALRLSGAHPH